MKPFFRSPIFFLLLLLQCFSASATDEGRFYHNDATTIKSYVGQQKWDIGPKAKAIVLFEKVNFTISLDAGGFSVLRTVHRQVKILNKEGLKAADVSVPAYFSAKHSVAFKKVTGITYNIENGVLVSQELLRGEVKKDVANENVLLQKFSMPAVREGSVIDYKYEIEEDFSPFFNWEFQSDVPVLYSEASVMYPAILNVGGVLQSKYKFVSFDDTKKNIADSSVPLAYTCPAQALNEKYVAVRWVRRNISALEDEPFVFNIDNYMERIMIQVSGNYASNDDNLYANWNKFTAYVRNSERMFAPLKKDHRFLSQDIADAIRGKNTDEEKARAIFAFVRSNFAWNGEQSIFTDNGMEKVYSLKKGNVTEINMVLIKMLQQAGLIAEPVILSTRAHLRAIDEYPLFSRFNYTVAKLDLPDTTYYLDATGHNNVFGTLPLYCYNGYARVIDETPASVNLYPSMHTERGLVAVHTINDSLKNYILGFTETFSIQAGVNMRNNWQIDSLNIKKHIQKYLKSFTLKTTLLHYTVSHLNDPDQPLTLSYEVQLEWPADKSIVLDPCLYKTYAENPFNAKERQLPVEMPCGQYFVYALNLKVPQGWHIDEIPQAVSYKIDDNNSYAYLIEKDTAGTMLNLHTILRMKDTEFDTSEYDMLRNFFTGMIKCQQQPVVLKKENL